MTTPDGTVTVAAHSPGDPALAADVTRAVDGLLAGGALDLRRRTARPGPGWVALVGGGPGADGLLTGRARELLASADVVVVDRLAPRGVVDRLPVDRAGRRRRQGPRPARPGPGRDQRPARRARPSPATPSCGSRAATPTCSGAVARSGWPARRTASAVEVVPGVTSAVAVPAAAGIPVTHRGVARGFTVVTGHDELPAVPPGTDHTVVLLMGVGRLARSARSLLDAGRPASCPVAVVERGFAPDQRVTFGTLADIAARATAVGVENPAVVVVGRRRAAQPRLPPLTVWRTWVKNVVWTTIFTHVREWDGVGRRQPTSERSTYCRMPPLR